MWNQTELSFDNCCYYNEISTKEADAFLTKKKLLLTGDSFRSVLKKALSWRLDEHDIRNRYVTTRNDKQLVLKWVAIGDGGVGKVIITIN